MLSVERKGIKNAEKIAVAFSEGKRASQTDLTSAWVGVKVLAMFPNTGKADISCLIAKKKSMAPGGCDFA